MEIKKDTKDMEINKSIKNLVKKFYKNLDTKNFIPGKDMVPVSGKVLDNTEIEYMTQAVLDGWLTTGRFNKKFESELASFLNVKLLLTVNSGSSANLTAFSVLTSEKLGDRRILPGDEVITAAAGFPTTINPIIQNGAIPVFVDSHLPNCNINEDLVEAAITKKTKAIMAAHTLGNPFNLKKILEICKKNNLWLIEDNCDALGSTYNGQMTGTFGDIGTLSFYPAHHITMGEGGAVFTNNLRIKNIALSFRDWGRDCYCNTGVDNTCGKRFEWKIGDLPRGYDHKNTYSHMGYNFKITDMQAACGLAQLKKLDFFIQRRKENYKYLQSIFKDFSEFLEIAEATQNSDPSWFGFLMTMKINTGFSRDSLCKFLNDHKIGTRLLFAGNVVKQPYMKDRIYKIHGTLINADRIMKDTFWIGLYPGLNVDHFNYCYEVFKKFFKK
jgi:CDP-6-deoxy-D-xylo-4-hexulose-3-dehydrase